MPNRSFRGSREAFGLGKFILVVGSMGPLFALWGIKGATAIPDLYLIPACTLMIVLPLVLLWWRFRSAKRNNDTRQLVVDRVEGYGHHILTYIIAMLLPFYRQDIATLRDVLAIGAALLFVVIIFWNLNLHYINIAFVLGGYRTYLIHPPDDGNPFSGTQALVLVTRRSSLRMDESIIAYRISDTFLWERRVA